MAQLAQIFWHVDPVLSIKWASLALGKTVLYLVDHIDDIRPETLAWCESHYKDALLLPHKYMTTSTCELFIKYAKEYSLTTILGFPLPGVTTDWTPALAKQVYDSWGRFFAKTRTSAALRPYEYRATVLQEYAVKCPSGPASLVSRVCGAACPVPWALPLAEITVRLTPSIAPAPQLRVVPRLCALPPHETVWQCVGWFPAAARNDGHYGPVVWQWTERPVRPVRRRHPRRCGQLSDAVRAAPDAQTHHTARAEDRRARWGVETVRGVRAARGTRRFCSAGQFALDTLKTLHPSISHQAH